MDFAPFASVNIIGFNSPEWNIADIGTIAAGGIAAGIYTTNLPEACAYVAAQHSRLLDSPHAALPPGTSPSTPSARWSCSRTPSSWPST